jgi:hypothetical protein
MPSMKNIQTAILPLAAAIVFCWPPASMTAQSHHHRGEKAATITGCLQKGDEAGEYSMRAADGKLYGLTSRRVALKDHVGHQVMLHGFIKPESGEKPSHEASSAKAPDAGDIDITVTSLKMIAKTCTQQ